MKRASIIAAILAPICIAAGHLLLPLARRADAHRLPDGTLAVFGPEAGLWSIKWGWIVGLSFLALAIILTLLGLAFKGDRSTTD